jgi:Bacteriophage head to tail connecting protein
MANDRTLKKQLKSWRTQLVHDRQTYHGYWTDVQEYILPERGRFIKSESESEVNNGKRKDYNIINSVATDSLEVMANGIQSGLTSKARPWIALSSPDPRINALPHVQLWFKHATETLTRMFASSNIYNCFLGVYKELGGFGTAAMIMYEHPTKGIFCKNYTIGSYWISTDERMEMDAFFSISWLTVKQVVDRFGIKHVCDTTKQAYERKNFETRIKIIEAIIKNPKRLGFKVPNGMPIAAVYYEDASPNEDDKLLGVSGFRTMPVMAVRWDTVDSDNYGYGPTRKAIGDVMSIQKMEKDKLRGVAASINPAMQGPSVMERQGINASPGAYNAVNNQTGSRPAITPLYQIQPDIKSIQFAINEGATRIKTAFFNDLFKSIQSQDTSRRTMTATEASLRNDEAFLILGPVIERVSYELLDPAVDRGLQLGFSAGLIEPPPEELNQGGVKVEYTSILSQAQKAVSTSRISNVAGFIGSLVGVIPQIKNKLKESETVDEYAEAVGFPAGLLNSKEEYDEINNAENEAMRAAEQAKLGNEMAQAGKTMSETDPGRLKETVGAITGGGMF